MTSQSGEDVAADLTMRHMEQLWLSGRDSNGGLGLDDGPEQLAGRLHNTAADVELEWQQWPLRVVQPTTDIQEAAMQPPVPLEALLTPAVWSCRQQQLLDRANSCDACGKEAQLKHCARCGVALYCSFSCFQQDAERHAHICSQLAGAAKRYSPRTLSCKPSSAALQPPCCSSSSSSSRVSSGNALVSPVRDCVEGVPWGLCSSAGPALDQLPVGVVPAELYMEQCRKTLNQILHAAPDTATNSLDAAGSSSSSSSSRSSLYKNAWVDPWHGYGF
ncbi:hypothetical protein OEZ86_013610 [Tetradesmus obliquus]|nr:hypothetical protein OEZ86_013610 [Tetradesmus obliquus]